MNSSVNSAGLRLLFLVALPALTAGDWPRFRGPDGSAVSAERDLPGTWSSEEGIDWKTALPGPGASSPITSGDRVFLTCYSGYGTADDAGNPDQLQRHLVCLDRPSGRILWDKTVSAKMPVEPYRGPGLPRHGYASSTPATDGERVYVFYGTSGALAYDFSGNELWHVDLGSGIDNFGTAASPIVYKNTVIVNASIESASIVALNARTGEEVWRASSQGYGGSWGTPILVNVGDDKQELVISVTDEVWGLNPDTGKLLWYVETAMRSPVCPSLIAHGETVYAIGTRRGAAVALRAGGRGNATASHVLWQANVGSYVPSPVAYGDFLYWVNDDGIAHCLNAQTGEGVYHERLGASGVYASMVAADEKLYVVSRGSGTFVIAPGAEFKILAHNKIADDDSVFNGSPAISNGQLLLRSDRFVYCLGKRREP